MLRYRFNIFYEPSRRCRFQQPIDSDPDPLPRFDRIQKRRIIGFQKDHISNILSDDFPSLLFHIFWIEFSSVINIARDASLIKMYPS